jgi:hypothetical protein
MKLRIFCFVFAICLFFGNIHGQAPALDIINTQGAMLCPAFPVNIIVNPTLPGSNPIYEWFINGVPEGNGPSLNLNSYANNDTLICLLISDDPNRTQDSAWSNKMILKFESPIIMNVDTHICPDQYVIFDNQAYTTDGYYEDTMPSVNGCDSILRLTLLVVSRDSIHFYDTTCSSVPVLFNGQELVESGIYMDTIPKVKGCDSILFLHLLVKKSDTTFFFETRCASAPYFFKGDSLRSTGFYIDTLVKKTNGCDSFIWLFLTINPLDTTRIVDSFCIKNVYTYDTFVLDTPGVYHYAYKNSNGCDSLVILTLTHNKQDTTILNQIICPGTSYFFKNQNFVDSGTYVDTVIDKLGCDSIVILKLKLYDLDTTHLYDTIYCTQNYTNWPIPLTDSGVYYRNVIDRNGCDSTLALHLTKLILTKRTFKKDTICSNISYFLNSNRLYNTGIYIDTITSFQGCDSIITVDLTVFPTGTFRFQDTMCQGQRYFFNNTFITKPGIYQDTITNPFGCDSIVRLYLLLKNGPSDTTRVRVCPGDVYAFGTKTFSGRGVYYDTLKTAGGCDSVRVLFLEYGLNDTVGLKNGINFISAADDVSYQWYSCSPWKKIANENKKTFTTTTTGSYCVVISNGRCSDTSKCQSLYSSGLMITNQNSLGMTIFPNPVGDRLFISVQRPYRTAQAIVFDALGRSVADVSSWKTGEIELNTRALARGIYFLRIELDDMIFYHKIEKE